MTKLIYLVDEERDLWSKDLTPFKEYDVVRSCYPFICSIIDDVGDEILICKERYKKFMYLG